MADNRTLYVGCLDADTDTLLGLCADFGEVLAARPVVCGRGRSRGFGYVTFRCAKDALRAQEALNGQWFAGRELRVAPAS